MDYKNGDKDSAKRGKNAHACMKKFFPRYCPSLPPFAHAFIVQGGWPYLAMLFPLRIILNQLVASLHKLIECFATEQTVLQKG